MFGVSRSRFARLDQHARFHPCALRKILALAVGGADSIAKALLGNAKAKHGTAYEYGSARSRSPAVEHERPPVSVRATTSYASAAANENARESDPSSPRRAFLLCG